MKWTDLWPNPSSSSQQLLRRAHSLQAQLPEPTTGSLIALAFGHDRDAFVAALLAVWLKGHGATIVENSLRDRILPVLDRASVAMLLHDTGSGRELQVPRFLATSKATTEQAPAPTSLPNLTADPLLEVHVQTDDGQQQFCSWNATELAAAIDAVAEQAANASEPTGEQTPGLLSSLFVHTLAPLRLGIELATVVRGNARHVRIPGAPTTTSAHRPRIEELRQQDGIDDAAIVCTPDHQILLAIAGSGAEALAREQPNARAFDSIPRDPNAQVHAAEIFLAFGLGRTGQAINRELIWAGSVRDDGSIAMRTEVPSNYLFYEGHFATYPVLAGGVQLHELVLPNLRTLCGSLPAIQELDGIKFLARIAPGDTIDVVLQRSDDPRKVTFEVQKAGQRCTSGRITFASNVPPLNLPTTP